jgi:hypothetical protein
VNPFRSLERFWAVRKERPKYFGLLFITFALGTTAASLPWDRMRAPQFLRALIPGLGEALMIAPILALIVDDAAKRKLLREFAVDVSSNIIGRHLPATMREAIRQYLSVQIIRSRWCVTYTIREMPNTPGYILMHTRCEWDFENRSDKDMPCPYSFGVERSWFHEIGETQITRWGFQDPWNLKSFDYLRGDKRLNPTLEGDMWTVRAQVSLPPHPHPVFTCWAECEEVYPNNFSAPFVAAYPVEHLTVIVRYPEGKFEIALLLSFEDSEVENPLRSTGEIRWDLSKPILPGQCFFTRWKAIGVSSSEISSSAAFG